MLGLGKYTSTDSKEHPLKTSILSPHFFSTAQLPSFGKAWFEFFVPNDELQQPGVESLIVYSTSVMARNVIMQQCLYLAKVYRELLKYKLSYAKNKAKEMDSKVAENDDEDEYDVVDLKIGIIGCGQVGTMILTKLLEIIPHFQGLSIFVSTRQPDLLREFKQEFGIEVVFDNEKVARKCDLIFICCLPFQADVVLREIRPIISERNYLASKDKSLNKPVLVSTMAAVGLSKLRLLTTDDTVSFRTYVDVSKVKVEISRNYSLKNLKQSSNQLLNSKIDEDRYSESEKDDKVLDIDDHNHNDAGKQLQLVKYEEKDDNLQIEKENYDKYDLQPKSYELSQASEHMVRNLDDLFNIFDSFQSAFYSGETQVAMKDDKEGVDDDKAVYEESILITILGDNYMDFIDPTTGEWANEKSILEHYGKLFNYEIESLLKGKQQT